MLVVIYNSVEHINYLYHYRLIRLINIHGQIALGVNCVSKANYHLAD